MSRSELTTGASPVLLERSVSNGVTMNRQSMDQEGTSPEQITVIINTFNRAESLRMTLESLCKSLTDGISASCIVVDDASPDHTQAVVASFQGRLKTRYVLESRKGKALCLNAALDQGGFGEIIAFLDDDMTVDKHWLKGVYDITQRHPDCDIFTGNSYVIWPCKDPPGWAACGGLDDWGFSVQNRGNTDVPIKAERWPGGGHFWIRSRVLACGIRFDEPLNDEFARIGYVSDPDFLLQLFSLGYRGMSGPDAVAGHRVQSELLDKGVMWKRARTIGRTIPYARSVYCDIFLRARILKRSMVLYWLVHLAKLGKSLVQYYACFFQRNRDLRFVKQMLCRAQIHNNLESLIHPRRIFAKLKSNEQKLLRLRAQAAAGGVEV